MGRGAAAESDGRVRSAEVWEVMRGSALLWLTVTAGAYWLGQRVQRWMGGRAMANPVLIAIVLVGMVLRVTRVSYATYFVGAQFLHFLLGPATVALAVPLVESAEHIRRSRGPIVAALGAGSVVSAVLGYGLVRVTGGTQGVALSMLPKAATTPIAMAVSERAGGSPSLTAVLAILGGVLVAVTVEEVLPRLGMRDERAMGLAAGGAGSGIAAAQVIPRGPVTAAFAGLAIGVNGLMTALITPVLGWMFRRW